MELLFYFRKKLGTRGWYFERSIVELFLRGPQSVAVLAQDYSIHARKLSLLVGLWYRRKWLEAFIPPDFLSESQFMWYQVTDEGRQQLVSRYELKRPPR